MCLIAGNGQSRASPCGGFDGLHETKGIRTRHLLHDPPTGDDPSPTGDELSTMDLRCVQAAAPAGQLTWREHIRLDGRVTMTEC
jgi:hypothetical protein